MILIEVFLISNKLLLYKKRRTFENSRRCDTYNVNVHRESYAKHLRSKKHLVNIKRDDISIPEWLFKEGQEHIKKEIKKYITLNLSDK